MSALPVANLLVIRSPDIERAVTFYRQIGMSFVLHAHGKGPQHYASDSGGFVFELYPQPNADGHTTNTRIGFQVDNVDDVIQRLGQIGVTIVTQPTDSEWGRRAVVKDFDGHTVELVESVEHEETTTKSTA